MNPNRLKKLEEWFATANLSEEERKDIIEYYEQKEHATHSVQRIIIPQDDGDCYRIYRKRLIPITCPACGSRGRFICNDVIHRQVVISAFGSVVENYKDGNGQLKLNKELTCTDCGYRFKTYNGPAVWDMDDKIITNHKKIEQLLVKKEKEEIRRLRRVYHGDNHETG